MSRKSQKKSTISTQHEAQPVEKQTKARKYRNQYKDLPGGEGNPLLDPIPLLPEPEEESKFAKMLIKSPAFSERHRGLSTNYRTVLSRGLLRFCFPTKQHIALLTDVHDQVVDGYLRRNPLTRDGQYYLHSAGEVGYVSFDVDEDPSTISLLTGLSGTGKSCAMTAVLRALSPYGAIVKHCCEYPGPSSDAEAEEKKMFTDTQLVSVRVNIPAHASTKTVAVRCVERVDEVLNVNFYATAIHPGMSRESYLSALRKVVKTNHVGILVLDEFQNVTLAGTKGMGEVVALLINLREELRIPIVVVGNYRAQEAFDGIEGVSFGSSRRLGEGFYKDLQRPESASDEDWNDLCEQVWMFQWVRWPIEYRSQIAEVLYECSQGVTGVMLTLVRAAQVRAMVSRTEKVDEDLLRKVYEEDFVPIHGCMDALKEGTDQALKLYEDMFPRAMKDLKINKLDNRFDAMREEILKGHVKEAEAEKSVSQRVSGSSATKAKTTRAKRKKSVVNVTAATKLPPWLE